MTARLFLLLLASLLLWPATARAQSCDLSVQPLSFGTIGTPTAQRDTTANVTVTCNGSAGSTVRVCLMLNGGAIPSTPNNRYLVNGLVNWLPYEITTTPGGANWGDYFFSPGQQVSVAIGGGGSGSATATMYGRIAAGENLPAGTYASTVTVTARRPSGNSPCGNFTGTQLDTASFNASVVLGGACTIVAAPLDFGTVASLATAHTASGTITATCSNGMPYTIALNAGTTTGNTIAARRLSLNGAGPGVVSYQLYLDTGHSMPWGDGTSGAVYNGTGSGTSQAIPVHGRVPAQATPAAGTYRDTITATITY